MDQSPARLVAALEGRYGIGLLSHVDELALDAHHTFHLAEPYALAGEHSRAVALLDRAVTMGFYPHTYYERLCPFLEELRGRDDFVRVLQRAAARVAEFRA